MVNSWIRAGRSGRLLNDVSGLHCLTLGLLPLVILNNLKTTITLRSVSRSRKATIRQKGTASADQFTTI